jgi:lipoate-protein ligase A
MQWEILDTGCSSAEKNMQLDQNLLEELDPQGIPILHLYDWEGDCATFGHFLDPYQFLCREKTRQNSLNLAKRPTGGGIIFHICDLAFSALIPSGHPDFSTNTLDNYAFINNGVIRALGAYLPRLDLLAEEPIPLDLSCKQFCMAKPTKYDVMMHGKKIGGAAQRRTKRGLLHQGTISIALMPEAYLKEVLLPDTRVIEAMKMNSLSILGSHWTKKELQGMRQELKEALKRELPISHGSPNP